MEFGGDRSNINSAELPTISTDRDNQQSKILSSDIYLTIEPNQVSGVSSLDLNNIKVEKPSNIASSIEETFK